MLNKKHGAVAIVAGALVAAGAFAAETSQSETGKAKNAKVLGKVMVTAQRREQQAS